jgi:hypothetical protein
MRRALDIGGVLVWNAGDAVAIGRRTRPTCAAARFPFILAIEVIALAVMEAICGTGEKTGCNATRSIHGATAVDNKGLPGHEVAIG